MKLILLFFCTFIHSAPIFNSLFTKTGQIIRGLKPRNVLAAGALVGGTAGTIAGIAHFSKKNYDPVEYDLEPKPEPQLLL